MDGESLRNKEIAPENIKREVWLDVERTAAILAVVLCHSAEIVYQMVNFEEWGALSGASKLISAICFIVGRTGVPFFLFLTGYFMLCRNIEKTEDVLSFYKRKLLPLLIGTEGVIVISDIFLKFVCGYQITLKQVIAHMSFRDVTYLPHMWYMPTILGIYLVIPFLGKIVREFSIKALALPIAVSLSLLFVIPNVNVLLTGLGLEWRLGFGVDINYLGGIYGVYLLLGYLFYNDWLKKTSTIALVLLGGGLGLLAAAYQYWNLERLHIYYHVWYDFLPLLIFAVCLFEVIRRICPQIPKGLGNIFTELSKMSFGIYFLHYPILTFLWEKTIPWLRLPRLLSLVIIFLINVSLCLLVTQILKKIKWARRYLLLMK